MSSQQDELKNLAQHTLMLAKRRGIDAAELSITQTRGFSVTAHSGQAETLEHCQTKAATLTVYCNQRTGSAGGTDISHAALSSMIDKAKCFAEHAGKDPESGLPDPASLATHYPDLDLFHPWSLSPEQAIEMAIHCEEIGRSQDKRIVESEDVGVNTRNQLHIYANTHDFMGTYESSTHSTACSLIAEADGHKQRDYEYTVARDPTDLEDPALIAKRAAEKTLARLNARKIKTQQCPVILHAPVAKSLWGALLRAINGYHLYRKTSFLLDQLDTQILPTPIDLYQRPHLLKGMGSAPFDNEGVRTEDREYVKQGILTSYVLDSYAARKLNLKTTGNAGGVHNLFVTHADHSLTALCKAMGRGLLVTELIGQGVNIVTGDYSRGAVGLWIEEGQIQHAVHEVTIAGNLKDMLKQIIEIGNDIDHRSNIHTGSVWLEQMMVAGE